MPVMYIIAGPNGYGKTAAEKTFLPEFFGVTQFVNVNADEIAKVLSPHAPETGAVEARRLMLARIKFLIQPKEDFAFETTLPTISYKNTLKQHG